MLDFMLFLEDLYYYIKKNDIYFDELSREKQNIVIKRMLKYVCHNTSKIKL